jgi:hypothetical protein
MHSLTVHELLDIWEKGTGRQPVYHGLAMLAALCPNASREQLARLTIGERDSCLLKLRELTFGSQMTGLATCSACGEKMELKFSTSDIKDTREVERDEIEIISFHGYELQFRLPNSIDLVSISKCSDSEKARDILLSRCILLANYQGHDLSLEKLPSEVLDAVVTRMERIDSQADVQLELICSKCSHRWLMAFDITTFFWKEIDHWAKGLLQDVHVLATAYGWSEDDILEMSPRRRRIYLEMIGR